MHNKRDARIINNLAKHARLMAEYEAQGLSREEASRKAYFVVTGKLPDRASPPVSPPAG